MGSGDDVLGAIGHGHAAHLLGCFRGLGAIVHFRQDVTMDINHAGGWES
jgi:hypothetical protein